MFNIETTSSILAEVVPHALLQLDQENLDIKIEGLLLASIGQYVTAIAVEEDSNMFRTHLLGVVYGKQERLIGYDMSDILGHGILDVCETPYVIEGVKWMLKPLHQRDPIHYPTRSLLWWTVATIMQKLGFQVTPSTEIINSVEMYEKAMDEKICISTSPETILVTTNAGPTDIHASTHFPILEESRHQIISLRNVPWLTFKHLGKTLGTLNVQGLTEVWTLSYTTAYKQC